MDYPEFQEVKFTQLNKAVTYLSNLMIKDDIENNIVTREDAKDIDYISASEHEAKLKLMESENRTIVYNGVTIKYCK